MARHPSGQQPRRGGDPHTTGGILSSALFQYCSPPHLSFRPRRPRSPRPKPAPKGTIVQTYEELPAFPVDMAWAPGTKTIFYTEKDTGKIRVIRNGVLQPLPCRNLRVDSDGEQGALGIVLDPDYATNGYLYVYYSSDGPNDNRVARFKVVNYECTQKTTIFDSIPDYIIHNGGQLEFMDGHLFVTTGDAGSPGGCPEQRLARRQDPATQPRRLHPRGQPLRIPHGASCRVELRAPQRIRPCTSRGHRSAPSERERPRLRRRDQQDRPRCQLRMGRQLRLRWPGRRPDPGRPVT